MKVFVDSGVYMDYLQGNGSLRVLKTFEELLDKGEFGLIFPHITKEEIYRGVPIDYARFAKNKFKLSMPDVPAGVEEGKKYLEAKELLEKYSERIEEVRQEALSAVDEILHNHIDKLFAKADAIREDDKVLGAAQVRKLKNNPPGKSTDPLGDEIVWELLLQKYTGDDLSIIAHDGDWRYEDNGKGSLHPFLKKEWDQKQTGKSIKLFPSIAPFIESIAPKKVTKKDIETEKIMDLPVGYGSQEQYGNRINGNFVVVPLSVGSASPSGSPSVSQWQPVTVSGSASVSPSAGAVVQCFSCSRMVPIKDYYGLTPQGYMCKFCAV